MSAAQGTATLIFSVDLDAAVPPVTDDRRAIEATATALLHALGRAGMTATFCAMDPAASRLVDRILAADTRAEIALLAAPDWSGGIVARQPFANELARHVARARAAGYALHSLAVPAGPVDVHADLLMKHGFRAVRRAATAERPRGMAGVLRKLRLTTHVPPPRQIRFGLWEIAVTMAMPIASPTAARRRIDLATASGGIVHVTIDVPKLAVRGRDGLADVERTIEHAASRAAEGRLAVAGLAVAASGFGRGQASVPATSILRSRAA